MGRLFLFGLVALVLSGVAFFAGRSDGERAAARHDADINRDLDIGADLEPRWPETPCRPVTPDEAAQNRVALTALQTFDTRSDLNFQIAAVKYFGRPWAQSRKLAGIRGPTPCAPVALYPAVAAAAVKAGVFDPATIFEDELRLAGQVGPLDPKIVRAVSATAFSPQLIPDEIFHTDLRPLARLTLAKFGAAAQPWAATAFQQISDQDRMGTSAAELAVAGGDPRALPRVEALMRKILRENPVASPIPRTTRNRLYELAYALGLAGPAAQPYARPLIDLLDRKIESLAPPFGLIPYDPVRMCAVAEHIGGAAAATARAHSYCRAVPRVFEQ